MLPEHVIPKALSQALEGAARPTRSQPMSSGWRGARESQGGQGKDQAKSEDSGYPGCSRKGDLGAMGHKDTSSNSTTLDYLAWP